MTLQHVPAWMLALGNGPADAVMRTMAWMGPDAADKALAKIRRALSNSEWLTLAACRAALSFWMARAIDESVVRDPGRQSARRPLAALVSGSEAPNADAETSAEIPFNQTTGAA